MVALPLVLPPTVLGFYLLVALGPQRAARGAHRRPWAWALLPFTFAGLVVGSVVYSMPFVVQPIQNAFEAIGERPLEAAATLRASPLRRFLHAWRCRWRARASSPPPCWASRIPWASSAWC